MAQNAYKTANFWGNAKWKLCSIEVEGSYYQLAGVHPLSLGIWEESQSSIRIFCNYLAFGCLLL